VCIHDRDSSECLGVILWLCSVLSGIESRIAKTGVLQLRSLPVNSLSILVSTGMLKHTQWPSGLKFHSCMSPSNSTQIQNSEFSKAVVFTCAEPCDQTQPSDKLYGPHGWSHAQVLTWICLIPRNLRASVDHYIDADTCPQQNMEPWIGLSQYQVLVLVIECCGFPSAP
jgi:hypothetical protein